MKIVISRRFRRWCHLMWQLMKFKPHRAVTMYAGGFIFGVGVRFTWKIACDCGKEF